MFRALLALTLLTGLALPAAAQDNPIVARMQAFIAAFNAGDGVALATFYT